MPIDGSAVLSRQRGLIEEHISNATGPEHKRDFESYRLDDALAESIDDVLGDLVGRRAREAIYDYLERNYKIARDFIPRNLETFFTFLEQVFGKSSRTIGNAIAARLFVRLGWKFTEVKGFEFMDYLEAARARIARESIQRSKSDKSAAPVLY
jgi:hypothetical protein